MVAPSDRRSTLSAASYRRLTLGALLSITGIVVTGAAVRLTGSGLGCSDWPTCEDGQLVAPLEFHAMVEFVNRAITGAVSVAVILAVLGSLRRRPYRRDLVWWSCGLVAGVVAQILWGGVTVLTHLNPAVVQVHFLLSMVLVWNAVVLHHRAGHDGRPGTPLVEPAMRRLTRVLGVLGAVVLLTGTVVTASGPHRGDEDVEPLGFDISHVARLHGLSVVVLLAVLVATLVLLQRSGAPAQVLRRGQVLLVVCVAQGAVGYLQYFNGVPALLVGVHVAGATAVWVATVQLHLATEAHGPEAPNAAAGPGPADAALVGS